MIIKMWKQECSRETWTLNYHSPEHFTRCHWQKSDRVLVWWAVYRGIMSLYFFLSFAATIFPFGRELPEEFGKKYIIFLTHWTYLLEVVVFFYAFVIVAIKIRQERRKGLPTTDPPPVQMPMYYKIFWILYTIVVTCAVAVTVIFWASIYTPEKFKIDATNVMEHICNSVFIVLDFFLMGFPIRFAHFYFAPIYALIYTVFSIVYYLCGGTGTKGSVPIYDILDWRQPGPASLTCLLCAVFLVFLHFLFSLLSILKFYIKKKSREPEN